MREAAGRVILFDVIAEGLLQLYPGSLAKILALFSRDHRSFPDIEDQIALAEAVCRLCTKSSSHVHITTVEGLAKIEGTSPLVIKAGELKTSDVLKKLILTAGQDRTIVIINYSTNDSDTVLELRSDIDAESYLIEQEVRKLFEEVRVPYDPLAVIRFAKGGFRALSRDFNLFDEPKTADWEDPKVLELFCHKVSQSWSYEGRKVDGDDVYKWIGQFRDHGLIREACELLVYLKREGFVTQRAIVENLRGLYQDHSEKLGYAPLVVSIQPLGKSEHLLTYPLKPYMNFISQEAVIAKACKANSVLNVVCIDDAIVSGSSLIGYLFDPKRNQYAPQLMQTLRERRMTITVIASHVDERGMLNIESDARGCGAISVKAAKVINETRRTFHPQSVILSGASHVDKLKTFCESIGRDIYPGNPLGWNDAQWCIVLDYSVPNGTLPILFASSSQSTWQPLFTRQRTALRKNH